MASGFHNSHSGADVTLALPIGPRRKLADVNRAVRRAVKAVIAGHQEDVCETVNPPSFWYEISLGLSSLIEGARPGSQTRMSRSLRSVQIRGAMGGTWYRDLGGVPNSVPKELAQAIAEELGVHEVTYIWDGHAETLTAKRKPRRKAESTRS